MTVQIPISTKYDGKGFDQAEKDARRAAAEAAKLAREQERAARAASAAQDRAVRDQVKALNWRDNLVRNSIKMEMDGKKRLADLTAKLDGTGAGGGAKERIGQQVAGYLALQSVLESAARFTIDFAKSSIEASNQAKITETAFRNLSGGAAEARDNLEAMGRATRELATEQEQQAIANQLLGMGLVKNADELEKLVGGSRRLGAAFKGLGAADAANEFALLLSNMSYMRLDQFGLSAGKVRDRVNELKDAGMGTEEAFKVAVFEQMDETLKRLGPEIETGSQKIERMAAKYGDLQVAVGNVINAFGQASGAFDAISGSLETAATGLNAFADASEASERLRDKAYEGRDGLKAFEDAADTTLAVINPLSFAVEKLGTIFGNQVFNAEAMAQAHEEIEAVTAAGVGAVEEHTEATKENTDATKENAKALEEAARKAEAANAARKSFASDLLDITDQAAQDTAAVWDDYYKEEAGAWADYQKNVQKIQADSAKEQEKIQKDLAKTLADIDKNLTKDLAKLDKDYARERAKAQRDGARQISRMEQDTAREERQQRRQRQIEARGDQRLFDYDMRQLAAEGEFNQIQQAMERRAIEQQIAAERTAEEDRVRQENSQVEIQRAREDLAQRLAEMEEERNLRREELIARAEEERAMAIEQAAEAEARRQEELAQALADEQQNYQDRLEALRQNRDEKLAAIEEQKQANLAKLGEEMAETKDLTRSEMEALIPVAQALGEDVGAAFADGLNSGFARNARINEMVGGMTNGAPTATPSSRPGYHNQNRPSTGGGGAAYQTTLGTPFAGFANGIRGFVVPPGFHRDNYLVGLTSGERVDVTPAGQRRGGDAPITVNVNGIGGNDLAGIIKRKVEEGVNEYHSNVIVPWSQG